MVGEGFGSKLITAAYSLQPKMIILGVSFFWISCPTAVMINLFMSQL